jgi:hypothetical protein
VVLMFGSLILSGAATVETTKMTVEQIAEKILALVVEKHGGVTYVEIMNCIGEEAKGALASEVGGPNSNMFEWAGMSQVLTDAMTLLLKDSKIVRRPTSFLRYLVDGGGLNFPIAKRMPKAGGFKHPRWIPTVFNLCKPKSGGRIS